MPKLLPPAATALRVHCSRRTRWVLGTLATAVAGLAFLTALLLTERPGGAALGWALFGLAVVVTTLVVRALPPEEACAWCGRARAQVRLLIAAPHVSLCDGCTAGAMGALAAQLEREDDLATWVRQTVSTLPRKCPTPISRALLEVMRGESTAPADLREVGLAAARLHNPAVVLTMLEQIPEDKRTSLDWVHLGVALGKCGRYAEALAATATALACDDGRNRPWCLNNEVWYTCRQGRELSEEERSRWLAQLDEARRLLTEQRPEGWELGLQACDGTEAELHRCSGDGAKALRALAHAETLGPLNGERHLIRGRVLAAATLAARAREEARSALRDLHPESLSAQEAQELLTRL